MTAEDDFEYENERPNKSQLKRDAEDMKLLGDHLVQMAPSELARIPLPENLRDAIELARRISAHGGAARQRQLIGKLLRKTDVTEIQVAIEAKALEERLQAREFHRIETWRNRLVSEGEAAVTALLATYPQLDAGRLRSLVGTAQHEAARGRPPAASRELFRWLRETLAEAPPGA
jgi:ribosome-associated protein